MRMSLYILFLCFALCASGQNIIALHSSAPTPADVFSDPSDETSTRFWIETTNAAFYTTSGSDLTSISDQSANDVTITLTGTSQYESGTLNGEGCFRFNANEYAKLEGTGGKSYWSFLHTDSATIFAVLEYFPLDSTPEVLIDFLTNTNGATNVSGARFLIDDRAGGPEEIIAYARNGTPKVYEVVEDSVFSFSNPHILYFEVDAATTTYADRIKFEVDSVGNSEDNVSTASPNLSSPFWDLYLNTTVPGYGPYSGDLRLYELIICDAILNDTRKGEFYQYLQNKWGL